MQSRIISLLEGVQVPFCIVSHSREGRCLEGSARLECSPQQACKALVFQDKKATSFVLAVLAGDSSADSKKLGAALGLKQLTFASPEKVLELTGCEVGTVGMFSFRPDLKIVVDAAFVEANRGGEIVGGLGSWEESIFMSLEDYLRVAKPEVIAFSRTPIEAHIKPDSVQF